MEGKLVAAGKRVDGTVVGLGDALSGGGSVEIVLG